MCADAGHFAEQIASLEKAGVNSFHLDVMDGEYVKNFALSWGDIIQFKKLTSLPLDVHLMVNNLKINIEFANKAGVNRVFVHIDHPQANPAIDFIKSLGMEPGIAINPEIPSTILEKFKNKINSVLLMRVKPGFAGQSAIKNVDKKVCEILEIMPKADITVDGAVSLPVIKDLYAKGANGFVLGTSALFGKKQTFAEIISLIKKENNIK